MNMTMTDEMSSQRRAFTDERMHKFCTLSHHRAFFDSTAIFGQ
jgi:hypothetical protein